MTITCNKCGIVNGFIKEKGTQTGLYCNKCGKWIKWLTKDEIRLFNFSNTDSLNKKSYIAGYNKAVDDFYNKIIEAYEEMKNIPQIEKSTLYTIALVTMKQLKNKNLAR